MTSRKRKLPKPGDKTLSAALLAEMSGRIDRQDRLTVTGGEMSMGPSGTAIIIPESEPAVALQLMEHDALPASFGSPGFFYKQLVPFSPRSGADVPPVGERRAFPRLQCQKWAYTSSRGTVGNATGTTKFSLLDTKNFQLINPFGLPLGSGLSWCALVDSSTSPETWVVVNPSAVDPWGMARHAIYAPIPGPYAWDLKNNEAQLIRGYVTNSGNFSQNEAHETQCPKWCFVPGNGGSPPNECNGDVMLIYPGVYDVSFGFSAQAVWNSPAASEQTVAVENNTAPPTVHSHTFKVYHPPKLGVRLHVNFEPGSTSIGPGGSGPGGSSVQEDLWVTAPFHGSWQQPYGMPVSAEKRVRIFSDMNPWHGQPHTRLSLGMRAIVTNYESGSDSRGPSIRLLDAWISVRPAAGVDGPFYWPGANVFPEGYTQAGGLGWPLGEAPEGQTSAGYQWWGAGDKPKLIDATGAFAGDIPF